MRWLALFGKETSVLASYWLAGLVLVVSSALLQMLGTDVTLDPLSTRVAGGEFANFLVFLLAFSIGHAVIAPEFAEGQIEFLDSLPTSRFGLFMVKLVAAVMPCLAIVVGSLVADGALAILSPGPTGTQVLPTLLVVHGVFFSGALAGLGMGMALSWLRGLAWGVLILVMVTGLFLGIVQPPLQSYVPLFGTWGTVEFVGAVPGHPWGPVIFWSIVGLLGIGLSFLLFLGPGARLVRPNSWATAGARIGVMGCLSLFVLVFGGFSMLGLLFRAPELFMEGVRVETTEHFRILYRPDHESEILAATSDVDALSAEIGELVGNPEPVELDLEFLGAAPNHLGVFTGGKIRLVEAGDRNTLAHELTHAHAFALSGSAAWHQSEHMRFFDEGLANWTAATVLDAPKVPLVAAAIHRVDPVEFDLLVEDGLFQRERDLAQVYPVGQAFVEALDQFGGAKTRGCVLSTAGSVGREKIAGLALWVMIAETCDFELDAVVARLDALLEKRAADLPPVRDASVTVSEGRLTFLEPDGSEVCRFRDNEESEVNHYISLRAIDGRCDIPTWRLSGLTFDYQVSAVHVGGEPVFTRWVTAPLP